MNTTIEIIIIEDSLINERDCQLATEAAEAELHLSRQKIALKWAHFERITSSAVLEEACEYIRCGASGPRIIVADLDLTNEGLSADAGFSTYNRLKNSAVPNLPEREKLLAGGLIAVMKAFEADSAQQLVCVATNRGATDLVTEQIVTLRTQLGKWGKWERLNGGLDRPTKRTQYLVSAIRAWISAFGCPRARLWPDACKGWFHELHSTVPHDYGKILAPEEYGRAIVGYFSRVLQVSESVISAQWSALPEEKRRHIHNYLKGFVGAHAAAHVGSGYHLRWSHLPLLAAASAPPPSFWSFDSPSLECCSVDILPPEHHSEESTMLDRLVGPAAEHCVGVFPALLSDAASPPSSQLKGFSIDAQSFALELCFDISKGALGRQPLKDKFETAKKMKSAPGGSSSNALFNAWQFFDPLAIDVDLNCERNAVVFRKR